MMMDILQDPKELSQRPQGKGGPQSRKKWLLALLILGLGGAGIHWGPQCSEWFKQYQCAKHGVENKQPDAALQCLEQFSPRAANLFVQLGMDLRQFYLMVINQWIAEHQYSKALGASKKAGTIFPWEPAFIGNEAIALFGLGKFKEAVEALELFLKSPQFESMKKANGVKLYLTAAQIYLGAQQVEQAERYLQLAAEMEPNHSLVHLIYARLEAFRSHMPEMAEHYEKALAGKSQEFVWQDLFLLALHYLNTNQTERFQQIFAQSRRDFPQASGFHLLLASKFLKEGNYASAYYEVLFEKEVGLTDAAYFKEALEGIELQYTAAFKQKPSEPWLFPLYQFIHGKQAYEAKDYPQAFAWIGESLQHEEHPLQSLYLGRALAGMGEINRAIEYYGKTLSRQETFALATAELAGLYLQKGLTETSQNLWNKALVLDPQIVKLSPVGEKLAEAASSAVQAVSSQDYAARSADHLMQAQLNQMVLGVFFNAFHGGQAV